eukprot:CAMPEP_0119141542 /NCGR_PEP_ID=MMETSP1310-20130426/31202_1 /TAXON_ID=464262 /ORGANISM="Genus nov. species nov., Strain RCC2339" /LENGTH=745 /DNA_ID=CAMNT_0007132995 /DNA_START=148 /DNA_END=2385 /DNA_ORIENTATION=-
MGNETSTQVETNAQCYVERLHGSEKPSDKEKLREAGIELLRRLEENILIQYPFLKEAREAACLSDIRLKDQPLIFVNDQFLKLTLYAPEEVIGRNCRFLQGKFTKQATVDTIRHAISAGEPCDVELVNYRKDGVPFWNNFLLLPVWEDFATEGKPTHYIAIQKDVTFIRPQASKVPLWTTEDVVFFCDSLRLTKLAEVLFDVSMTGREFIKLTDTDLDLMLLSKEEKKAALVMLNAMRENPNLSSDVMRSIRLSTMSQLSPEELVSSAKSRKSIVRLDSDIAYEGPSGTVNLSNPKNLKIWGALESDDIPVKLKFFAKNCFKDLKNPLVRIVVMSRGFPYAELESVVRRLLDRKNASFQLSANMDGTVEGISSQVTFDFIMSRKAEKTSESLEFLIATAVTKKDLKRTLKKTKNVLAQSGSSSEYDSEDRSSNSMSNTNGIDMNGSASMVESPAFSANPDELVDVISDPSMAMELINVMWNSSHRDDLIKKILRYYDLRHESSIILRNAVTLAISECGSDKDIIFRTDTAAVLVMCKWAEMNGRQYRRTLLNPVVTDLLNDEDPDYVMWTKRVVLDLIKTADDMPEPLRFLFFLICNYTAEVFLDCKSAGIVNFLFLRLIGPALVFPKEHGLAVNLDSAEQKKLSKFAKVMQKYVASSFAASAKDSFGIHLSILYSKLSREGHTLHDVEMDALVNSMSDILSHHELLEARARVIHKEESGDCDRQDLQYTSRGRKKSNRRRKKHK